MFGSRAINILVLLLSTRWSLAQPTLVQEEEIEKEHILERRQTISNLGPTEKVALWNFRPYFPAQAKAGALAILPVNDEQYTHTTRALGDLVMGWFNSLEWENVNGDNTDYFFWAGYLTDMPPDTFIWFHQESTTSDESWWPIHTIVANSVIPAQTVAHDAWQRLGIHGLLSGQYFYFVNTAHQALFSWTVISGHKFMHYSPGDMPRRARTILSDNDNPDPGVTSHPPDIMKFRGADNTGRKKGS